MHVHPSHFPHSVETEIGKAQKPRRCGIDALSRRSWCQNPATSASTASQQQTGGIAGQQLLLLLLLLVGCLTSQQHASVSQGRSCSDSFTCCHTEIEIAEMTSIKIKEECRNYRKEVGWLLACLTSQQHTNVSQGWIYSDNFTCCHTEIKIAEMAFIKIKEE